MCPTRDPSKRRQQLSRLSCILSVLFVFGTGAGLVSCSTTLATRPPRGVDLGGEWEIDLALSDFPQEAFAIQSAGGGAHNPSGGQTGGRHGRGGGGRGTGGGGGGGLS